MSGVRPCAARRRRSRGRRRRRPPKAPKCRRRGSDGSHNVRMTGEVAVLRPPEVRSARAPSHVGRTEGAASMPGETVAREPGQGTAFWMLGGLYEVKVSSAESDGALTIMEMTMPAGMGPPPHTHPGGESVRVLEGRIRYHIAGETFEGGPGSTFHVPAGTLENFEPVE